MSGSCVLDMRSADKLYSLSLLRTSRLSVLFWDQERDEIALVKHLKEEVRNKRPFIFLLKRKHTESKPV